MPSANPSRTPAGSGTIGTVATPAGGIADIDIGTDGAGPDGGPRGAASTNDGCTKRGGTAEAGGGCTNTGGGATTVTVDSGGGMTTDCGPGSAACAHDPGL